MATKNEILCELKSIFDEIEVLKKRAQGLAEQLNDQIEEISLGKETLKIVEQDVSEKRKNRITKLLIELGGSIQYIGFKYVVTGIEMYMNDPEAMEFVTKALYPEIAKKYRQPQNTVTVAMERLVRRIFEKGDIDKLEEIFGYSIDCNKGKVILSEFIAIIAEQLLSEEK